MSNSSPLIEEQHRFARSQTPESPRPVHVPEPANIPILRNQMDPVFNDTTTYNIPSDQNFAHYGETLENPNYKNTPTEENMDFKKFFLEAENQVAYSHVQMLPISSEPNASASASTGVAENHAASAANHANQPAPTSHSGHAGTETHPSPTQATLESTDPGNATSGQDDTTMQESTESKENGSHTDNNPDTGQPASAETKLADGVDYQSLLDTISQSASTAPAADAVTALTTEAPVPDTSHASSLPSFPGLPPKPPPLQTQSASAFSSSLDPTQYIPQPNAASGASQISQSAFASGYDYNTNGTKSSINTAEPVDLAVPNPFDVGITNEQAIALHMQNNQSDSKPRSPGDRSAHEPADRPWSPKTQAIYDAFLEDERRYVTEGIWDRFPFGSRLFVGNLPSEKVTKRDLFHRFHRFGKLAQISIKQAYGFVQYHDAASCKAALDAEQGVELRGRKVHLEVSKPQKNTKGAGTTTTSKPTQSQPPSNNRRRSRSPVRRSYSDFRDEPSRRREEYRTRRSPSPPRGYRRDDRTVSRNGPRSPMYGSSYNTPQPAAYDDEANLPYPRRDPRNVPDIQLIVIDTVDQAFINWIEDGFKRKGLSAATTWLNQRTPLQAVVKRQIVEGVQAVVKISSSHQVRSKIPLQVFDRGAGSSNVTFNEYADLDVPIAADLVLQARRRERGGLQPPLPPQYPPSLYQPQSPYAVSPNTSTGTASPWGPPAPPQFPPLSQQHLHPYQNPQQQQYRPPPQSPYFNTPQSATAQSPNLQDLLANLKGGTAPPTPQSAHSAGQPHTPYGQPHQQFPYGHPPQPPQYGQYSQPPGPQQQQSGQPQNVQHIMDQLARYQR